MLISLYTFDFFKNGLLENVHRYCLRKTVHIDVLQFETELLPFIHFRAKLPHVLYSHGNLIYHCIYIVCVTVAVLLECVSV